jgi:hypothetical protein
MEILNDAQWRLKSINISFQEWGEYKGKYVGKIEFANRASEAFSFNITDEKSLQFLALIRDNIVDSASKLGERLMQSLPPQLMAATAPKVIDDITPVSE